ncbi:hypothetical protein I316_05687 [Kwoniella heveanensis BCC8398]|uniref:Two-component system sensor protein n=1 Tax=Kwoniella heveanensis BCC8398 TaxID=1296120 RepID=A0A1B9GPM3_9TREE|nr:hypothetical protein I316_05687 [Kwoniella heveanensis BCC8398]
MAGRREFGDWISGAREDRAKIRRTMSPAQTGSTSFGLGSQSLRTRHRPSRGNLSAQDQATNQVDLRNDVDMEMNHDRTQVPIIQLGNQWRGDAANAELETSTQPNDDSSAPQTLMVELSNPGSITLELTKTILVAPQTRRGSSELPSKSHSYAIITSTPRSGLFPSALPQANTHYSSAPSSQTSHESQQFVPEKPNPNHARRGVPSDQALAGTIIDFQNLDPFEQKGASAKTRDVSINGTSKIPGRELSTVSFTSALSLSQSIGSTDVHRLYENLDWSKTPLGPQEAWPTSLKTMGKSSTYICGLSVMFAYPSPACIWWGPELTIIYNRANAKTIDKHPEIFGASGPVAWSEVWQSLGPLAEMALNGTPVSKEDDLLLLDAGISHGNRLYECYHSWSWVPIVQEDGTVGGLWNAVTETTGRVLLERRLATVRALAEQTSTAKTQEDFDLAVHDSLSANPKDIPFLALYHLESLSDLGVDTFRRNSETSSTAEQLTFHRTCSIGISISDPSMPKTIVIVPGNAGSANTEKGVMPGDYTTTENQSSSSSASSAASAFTEYNASDLQAWPIQKAVHTRRPILVRNCRRLISGFPIRIWDELPVDAVVIPLFNEHEQPVAVIILGLNVRRPFEQDYIDFIVSHSINPVKTQITSSLIAVRVTEAERRHIEDMEALDRAKNLLFSNISHEFRTPLTLIAGPLEDMVAETAEGKQKDLLTLAQSNVRRLNRLVSSLMDISRLEAGKLSCLFQPVNLGEFTRDLASMFSGVANKAHLQYVIECDSTSHLVFVDPDQWEKIVINLISNAIKYTMLGTVKVYLGYEDGHAILRVSDTGVGIPSSDIGRIGERFHRVMSTSRSFEGTGIGLSLVKELVRLHGGILSVTSLTAQESLDDSHGSTFTVTLPLGSDHLPPSAIQLRPVTHTLSTNVDDIVREAKLWTNNDAMGTSTPGTDVVSDFDFTQPSTPATGARLPEAKYFRREDVIMVVDGECRYVQGVFAPYCTVVEAPDGQEALDMCSRRQPDLIITDVTMPRVDGFQLLKMLKSSVAMKDIPVIMCTARGGEDSKMEGLMSGADDYLAKPFSPKELIARAHVQLLLGKNRKELQKAFEMQTQELRALTDYSPVGLFRISEGGEITFVNSYWYDLSGYPRNKPMDGWLECIVDEYKDRAIAFWMDMFKGTEQDTRTLDLLFTNGRWGDSKIIRLDLVSANLKGLLGCVTDITERVQQQDAQKRRLEEVEQRRLEAEEAKRQQELLIDITSHEIRNPISSFMQISHIATTLKTNLIGLKDQLEEALKKQTGFHPTHQLLNNIEEDLDALDSIYQCGLGQERICNDVLSLGRIQLELFDVDTNVRQQVQKVVSVFRSEARMNRISLSYSMGPNAEKLGIEMIKTDPVRLGQVMTNLLSNGIRFTSNSDIREIEISFDLSFDPPDESNCLPPETDNTSLASSVEQPIYLYIAVSDTGPGMTPDELEKLFQRFSQVSPKTHTIFGGSGLGLFVCRLGGRIEVVSDHGRGSTFRFFVKARTCPTAPPSLIGRRSSVNPGHLKAIAPPLKKRDTMSLLSSAKVTVPETSRKPHILIVEDNLINQTVLARQLKHVGFRCQVANNGLEALKKIRKVSAIEGTADGQPFDCVLMDLEMPIMDGLTAIRTIREQELDGQLHRNAVIALTGNARQGQIDEALAAGMDEVVIKPYRLDNLLSKIEGMLLPRKQPLAIPEESSRESSPRRDFDSSL